MFYADASHVPAHVPKSVPTCSIFFPDNCAAEPRSNPAGPQFHPQGIRTAPTTPTKSTSSGSRPSSTEPPFHPPDLRSIPTVPPVSPTKLRDLRSIRTDTMAVSNGHNVLSQVKEPAYIPAGPKFIPPSPVKSTSAQDVVNGKVVNGSRSVGDARKKLFGAESDNEGGKPAISKRNGMDAQPRTDCVVEYNNNGISKSDNIPTASTSVPIASSDDLVKDLVKAPISGGFSARGMKIVKTNARPRRSVSVASASEQSTEASAVKTTDMKRSVSVEPRRSVSPIQLSGTETMKPSVQSRTDNKHSEQAVSRSEVKSSWAKAKLKGNTSQAVSRTEAKPQTRGKAKLEDITETDHSGSQSNDSLPDHVQTGQMLRDMVAKRHKETQRFEVESRSSQSMNSRGSNSRGSNQCHMDMEQEHKTLVKQGIKRQNR